jgi:hypothetical protein
MTRETESSHVMGDDLFIVHFTTLSESRDYIASNEGVITNMAVMRNLELVTEKFNLAQNLYFYGTSFKLASSGQRPERMESNSV